jgi:hypothetical protein
MVYMVWIHLLAQLPSAPAVCDPWLVFAGAVHPQKLVLPEAASSERSITTERYTQWVLPGTAGLSKYCRDGM